MMSKINSVFSYLHAIGLKATTDYIIQRYITRKELIVLDIPGITEKIYLRRNSKDVNVFQQIFIKEDLAFLKGKEYKICIDAGANIGLSTIYMKNLFPDAQIFSIEPELANVDMLRLNTSGYQNITIISKALHEDSNGLFLFDTGNGSDSFQTRKLTEGDDKRIHVESISINDLMDQNKLQHLDFVKIDIEGAEEYCINQNAMSWINKTRSLAIEIHEHLVPGCNKKIKNLLKADFKSSENGEYSIFENLVLTN